MSPKARIRKATAFHEAGHAVIAYLEGVKFRYVTVNPGEDFAGMVRLHKVPQSVELGEWTPWARHQAEARIMLSLAGGYAAAQVFPRSHSSRLSDADWYLIDCCLGEYGGSNTDERNAYFRWLEIRTRNKVRFRLVWPLIESVADALMERKTLKCSEVGEIIRQTQKRLLEEYMSGLAGVSQTAESDQTTPGPTTSLLVEGTQA